MRTGWVNGLALAAALCGALVTGNAQAQTTAPTDPAPAAVDAPKKVEPKPKMAKPKVKKLPSMAVVVDNKRYVGLVELTATLSGSGADPVKIAGPLAIGRKVVAHVAYDKACLFDLHGVYADGAETEATSVELCKDKKIELTD